MNLVVVPVSSVEPEGDESKRILSQRCRTVARWSVLHRTKPLEAGPVPPGRPERTWRPFEGAPTTRSGRFQGAVGVDVAEGDVGVLDVVVTPPAGVADLLEALRESAAVADEAARVAAATRREVAEALRAEGLPLRDVGALIGLSYQRVSQLLAS